MGQPKTRKRPKVAGSKTDSGLIGLLQFSPSTAAVLLGLIALLLYANSLGGDFVFDDTVIIQGNQAIAVLDWDHIKEIFGGHYWQAAESRGGLYRPLVMLTYAVNAQFGGPSPQSYHLFNVLLHAVNGILVYFLLQALFCQRAFSFLAALLFVLHPIRTEGVASIVGRAESLSAFFVLAAWLVYSQYLQRQRFVLLWYSAALFALATLSKESAFAFVGLPVLTDLLMAKGSLKEKFISRSTLLRYLPYAVALALVLLVRILVLGGVTPLYVNPGSNPLVQADAWHRFLTATYVFARYLGLLVFPLNLSADYSFNQIPVVTGFFSVRGFLPVILLISLLTGIAVGTRRFPVLSFSGALFFLSFVLTSNWFRPIGTIMGERLMYFPALGYDCAAAFLICLGLKNARWRTFAALACILLAGGYGLRTINRNLDWRNHYTLFGSAARVAPNSALVQSNLAAVLLNEKNDARGAVEHAAKASEIQPDDPSAYFTLGQAYRRLGELPQAAQAFETVARLAEHTSGGTAALREAAALHESLGRHREAREDYEKLLSWRPADLSVRLGLSRACISLGETARAKEILEESLRMAPNDPRVQKALSDLNP